MQSSNWLLPSFIFWVIIGNWKSNVNNVLFLKDFINFISLFDWLMFPVVCIAWLLCFSALRIFCFQFLSCENSRIKAMDMIDKYKANILLMWKLHINYPKRWLLFWLFTIIIYLIIIKWGMLRQQIRSEVW